MSCLHCYQTILHLCNTIALISFNKNALTLLPLLKWLCSLYPSTSIGHSTTIASLSLSLNSSKIYHPVVLPHIIALINFVIFKFQSSQPHPSNIIDITCLVQNYLDWNLCNQKFVRQNKSPICDLWFFLKKKKNIHNTSF